MLRRLTVSNLAIVEKAEVEFCPGLNVITGETGAGKSVLMGALDLVLGARADGSFVREGAAEAEVEADFDGYIVRRTVTREGRSRAWINEESVSLHELKTFATNRVDIHGPRANQRLLEESFQREMLDDYGNIDLRAYAEAYSHLAELRSRRAAVGSPLSEEEADFLNFQINELESAQLSDEDETLAERHAAAAHTEELIESANAVTEGLGGDRGATEMLSALQPKFAQMARYFPPAEEWRAQAEELTVRAQELSRVVADAISKFDCGEEDLAALDARLTLVNRLKRKYKVNDVASLLGVLEEKKARLAASEGRDEVLAKLEVEIAAAEQRVVEVGSVLTSARRRAAKSFVQAIETELHGLGFLRSRFEVEFEPLEEPTVTGLDRVVYYFEPNPGEAARPLASIASSGEIARVMLALKVVSSSTTSITQPLTLVFDEIDANIGGEVGLVVGGKLRAVAQHHQVIAITHLPQTAVFGSRHLVVSKAVKANRTKTSVAVVAGATRVTEIARMLGGEKITSVVLKHAEELLKISC